MKTSIPLNFGEKHQPDFSASIQSGEGRFYSKVHWHDCFEIILVRQGRLRISVYDRCEYLDCGDIAIFPPGALHGTDSKEGFCEFAVFGYTENLIYSPEISIFNAKYLSLFRRARDNYRIVRRGEEGALRLGDMIMNAVSECEKRDFARELRVRSEILKLHSEICLVFMEGGRDAKTNDSRLNDIELYVERHISEDISPYTIAKEMHLSYSHLARLVNGALGYSVGELILRMKLNRAERLMTENPNASITEISLGCGFNSASYFTRCFRKMRGITPLKFKELLSVNRELS